MSQTICTPCESILSCSDSPLTTSGNVVTILTFAYGLLLGIFIFAIQLDSSTAEIKHFGKLVGFIKHRIEALSQFADKQNVLQQNNQVTKSIAEELSSSSSQTSSMQQFLNRTATLKKDFQPLLQDTCRLWSDILQAIPDHEAGEQAVIPFRLTLWKQLWWIYKRAEMKVRLVDVEANFTDLLFYAEKRQVKSSRFLLST
jgi:hypothetical protein